MAFRTSYSQNNTYLQCPKHWYWLYVEKYKPSSEGASLYFGSAIDYAVMSLLEDRTVNAIDYFNDRWKTAFQNGKAKKIFDSDTVMYSHNDFDEHVLQPQDKQDMVGWLNELQIAGLSNDPVEAYKEVSKSKKNPYKAISDKELKYFNRCSWLSLKRKGELLINAFILQFLPKVKKVHATQKYSKITDPNTGDTIAGYIDMILEIDGYDKPIIFDLKTAAMPYKDEDIDLTEQLTLYAGMEAINYNTNLVGYCVLPKMINKDTIANCNSCNHSKTGRHQTCDNIINGKRCGGVWTESKVLKPEVQVLVREKNIRQIDDLLSDISNIVLAMKNNVVYKNTNKCSDWYGNKCAYYNLCHKGDDSGLIKPKKDEQ